MQAYTTMEKVELDRHLGKSKAYDELVDLAGLDPKKALSAMRDRIGDFNDCQIRRNQFRELCDLAGIDPETPLSFASLRDVLMNGVFARDTAAALKPYAQRHEPIVGDSTMPAVETPPQPRKWQHLVQMDCHPANVGIAPSIVDAIIAATDEVTDEETFGRMIEIAAEYGATPVDDAASMYLMSDWHLSRMMVVLAKANNGKDLK